MEGGDEGKEGRGVRGRRVYVLPDLDLETILSSPTPEAVAPSKWPFCMLYTTLTVIGQYIRHTMPPIHGCLIGLKETLSRDSLPLILS